MSWMVMATSWAPPGSQPDMWVLPGLRRQSMGVGVGEAATGRVLVSPKCFHSSKTFAYSTLALSS